MTSHSKGPRALLARLKQDPVLVVSFLLALCSAFIVPPSADYIGYLDLRTLALLLSLMLVVAGLKEAGLFRWLVAKLLSLVSGTRTLAITLISVCFFGSMLITNDVALITFVPLTILLLTQSGKEELMIPVIVLQTIAANLGSMLTPIGNPQNLYLYSLSGMGAGEFCLFMAPPALLSLVLLLLSCLFLKQEPLSAGAEEGEWLDARRVLPWALLFALCLLTVAHVIDYLPVLFTVLLVTFLLDKKLLARADYGLLLTFLFFFVFIGNLKAIPSVSAALSSLTAGREMTAGILLSQVISNVPAAMLLSGFTDQLRPLLLGVNLGGLGTLIASMASLISYKLYAATLRPQMGRYMLVFTLLNLLFLAILWPLTALFF